eukprot:CAMPEP_0168345434 /NCGR_PEP_ID=MMETSP0213-20121227/17555_1 /TAXON_ID=151035 /ORGANISM="Euplotes harpa, Strain FSP1.4" /LENGTH=171 /DNA_ID=CAMNT_0008353657 /DNA_START=42 /DNA_END=553 /DNA_ORIENTATION=-
MNEYSQKDSQDDPTLPANTRILIDNASLSWGFSILKDKDSQVIDSDQKDINLKNISFEAKSGELIAIVGTVGCGKSTMLAAMMHELEVVEGSVRTNGAKAYVEQEPFIVSGTVKANILFGADYDDDLFDRAIEACCLADDLRQMSDGFDTLIGERGINVSGGQKARISLAR